MKNRQKDTATINKRQFCLMLNEIWSLWDEELPTDYGNTWDLSSPSVTLDTFPQEAEENLELSGTLRTWVEEWVVFRKECLHEPEAGVVLDEADQQFGVKQMAHDRARFYGFAAPTTPADYLWFIEHEAAIQEAQAKDDAAIRGDAERYAQELRAVALQLRALGIMPTPFEQTQQMGRLRLRGYFAGRERYLLSKHGPFSWRNRQWRNHWIVTHFMWAYLCWQLLKPGLGFMLWWGLPALALFGIGALVGHLCW